MTRHISHIFSAGRRLRVKIDGETVRDYTVPEGKLLRVTAIEHRIVQAGETVEIFVGETRRVNYTVPPGHVLVIESQQGDEP